MKLHQLHSELESAQDACSATCLKSGGCDATCCQPGKTGGEPSVTNSEIKLIEDYLVRHPGFIFYEGGHAACKFLGEDGKCKIYPVRPIDCRVHFCSGEAMDSTDNPSIDGLVCDYHDAHITDYLDSALLSSHVFPGESAGS